MTPTEGIIECRFAMFEWNNTSPFRSFDIRNSAFVILPAGGKVFGAKVFAPYSNAEIFFRRR